MNWLIRLRNKAALWAAGGGLMLLGGCGLTDQQLTSILASVITTGLSTVVVNLVNTLAGGTT